MSKNADLKQFRKLSLQYVQYQRQQHHVAARTRLWYYKALELKTWKKEKWARKKLLNESYYMFTDDENSIFDTGVHWGKVTTAVSSLNTR